MSQHITSLDTYRLLGPGDGATGHPLRVHVSRDYNIFTATGACSRWPSLILFSLGGACCVLKKLNRKFQ
jgi:hypothetical protein